MTRQPTNTLIITRLCPEILSNTNSIVDLLASRNYNVELVALPKFERYIVICPSATVATHVRDFLKDSLPPHTIISFSIKDNALGILHDDLWCLQDTTTYLELPLQEGSRRFLISPPLSPHSEWEDFGKEEEGPNKKAVYSAEELSHLLWDRFGGFDSSHVRKFYADEDEDDQSIDISDKPHILFEDISNGVPAIVLDSVTNQARTSTKPLPKTALPPT